MVDVPNEEAKLNPLAERAADLRTANIDYTFEERSMSIVRLKFETRRTFQTKRSTTRLTKKKQYNTHVGYAWVMDAKVTRRFILRSHLPRKTNFIRNHGRDHGRQTRGQSPGT